MPFNWRLLYHISVMNIFCSFDSLDFGTPRLLVPPLPFLRERARCPFSQLRLLRGSGLGFGGALRITRPTIASARRPPSPLMWLRRTKSKIYLLSANGYSPSTENGEIVPYHDMSRNRSSVECLGRLEGRRSQAENISGSFSMRSSTR